MPQTDPAFVVDAMLGRLARWLRALGYDTLYLPRGSDEELSRLAREEGRWLLTRDRRLAEARGPGLKALLVEGDDYRRQLAMVAAALSLGAPAPLSRCLVDNAPLGDVSAQEASSGVPEHVLRTRERFRRCPACGRIYWPGSHLEGMRRVLAAAGLRLPGPS